VSPIAKRRVSIDPRQLAIDFASPSAPDPAPIEAAPTHEERIALLLSPRLGACDVVCTENRRTVLSTLRRAGRTVVRLHRVFTRAPDDVIDAVGLYLAHGDRRASRAISAYVDANRPPPSATPRNLVGRGAVYDLDELFGELEREQFAGQLTGVGITWGRRGPRSSRRARTIRMGTYSFDERVIRVHPKLDQAWVPRFFVRFIVFHEMLHHVEPARETASRTEFHTPSFRARERAYPDYERAIAWERANIRQLLRS
jgi:hypothetical protein